MVAGGQGHLLLEETIREDDYKIVRRFFSLFILFIYLFLHIFIKTCLSKKNIELAVISDI